MKTALNQHVLVLNRLWQAVNVCTARRALTLLFQGHAQVVLDNPDGSFRTLNFQEWRDVSAETSSEESIHAVSFRIRVPKIILLFLYDRMPKKEVKFTRHNIFERDKNTCQYCAAS
jgi:5-methylcytosine-specific restriction endonuclease McrA